MLLMSRLPRAALLMGMVALASFCASVAQSQPAAEDGTTSPSPLTFIGERGCSTGIAADDGILTHNTDMMRDFYGWHRPAVPGACQENFTFRNPCYPQSPQTPISLYVGHNDYDIYRFVMVKWRVNGGSWTYNYLSPECRTWARFNYILDWRPGTAVGDHIEYYIWFYQLTPPVYLYGNDVDSYMTNSEGVAQSAPFSFVIALPTATPTVSPTATPTQAPTVTSTPTLIPPTATPTATPAPVPAVDAVGLAALLLTFALLLIGRRSAPTKG